MARAEPAGRVVGRRAPALLRRPDSRQPSLVAGYYVLPFAGIAFMWFMAALRDRTLRSGGREHTAQRAGLFPPWFARTSFVFALLLLFVTTLWRPVVLAIPTWVLGTSWFVLAERRNRDVPIDA